MVSLIELFDKTVPIDWQPRGNNHVKGIFYIDDKRYTITFEREYIEDEDMAKIYGGREGEYTWVMSFALDAENGKRVYDIDRRWGNSGTGDQFLVYSTILKAFEEFISHYKPKNIVFTGDKGLGKDALYQKMVKRVMNKLQTHGYSASSNDRITPDDKPVKDFFLRKN